MKKMAILIHGFNVADPERTVGKLKSGLIDEGYEVQMLRYGLVGLLGVRFINDVMAMQLADMTARLTRRGYLVDVFTHSNGAAILNIATERYGAIVHGAVCIQPALQTHTNPAPKAKFVHVYYNDEDLPVLLGGWLYWLNPFARKSRPWGPMGRYGYLGSDINVTNFDVEHDFEVEAVGHSQEFDKGKIEFFRPLISKQSWNGESMLTCRDNADLSCAI